jgi:ketosteroid isomerase-like protein
MLHSSCAAAALAAAAACLMCPADAAEPPPALHNTLQARALSTEEAAVWKVVEEWNAAFAANDVDRYFSFLDPEVVVLTASNPYRVEGRPDDRAEFTFGLDRGYSRVGYFEEVAPLVRIIGDVAIVTYFNRGYYGPPDGGQMTYLKETDVLARRGGEWRIVHIHVSR